MRVGACHQAGRGQGVAGCGQQARRDHRADGIGHEDGDARTQMFRAHDAHHGMGAALAIGIGGEFQHPKAHGGPRGREPAQARDQPFDRGRGVYGQGQVVGLAAGAQGRGGDGVEGGGQIGEQVLAGGGETKGVLGAAEQRYAQAQFQGLHLTADGAVGDAEFFGGEGRAACPRHGLEGAQGI